MSDIWSSGAFAFESPLKDLLDSGTYTLHDLLSEDELLQELRAMHPELIAFFSTEESVTGLIRCLIQPPPPSPSPSCCLNDGEQEEEKEKEIGEDSVNKNGNGEDEALNMADGSAMPGAAELGAGEINGDVHLMGDDQNVNGEIEKEDPSTATGGDTTPQERDSTNCTKEIVTEEKKENFVDDSVAPQEINNDQHPVEPSSSSPVTESAQTIIPDNNNDNATLVTTDNVEENKTKTNESLSVENKEQQEQSILSSSPINTSAVSTQEKYEKITIRYPYMACEVICCEIPSILDILVDGAVPLHEDDDELTEALDMLDSDYESDDDTNDNDDDNEYCNKIKRSNSKQPKERLSILDLFFSILINTPPAQLDDQRAGYLEKIVSVLFRRKPASMSAYINGDHLVEEVIKGMKGCKIDDHGDASGTVVVSDGVEKEQGMTTQDHDQQRQQEEEEKETLYPKDEAIVLHSTASTTMTTTTMTTTTQFSIHKGGGIALMKALFNQLHSYSIMHIIRALLMPRPPQNTKEEDDDGSGSSNGSDHVNSSEENEHDFSGNNGHHDEDEEDDNDVILGGGEDLIKCNWSEYEETFNLLLDSLFGESLPKNNSTATDTATATTTMEENLDHTRVVLDISQHASEVLITIIQNSLLTSSIMHNMTSDNILSRLVFKTCGGHEDSISTFKDGEYDLSNFSVPTKFSIDESMMTTSMNVLESLVLQLGGYGAVPTVTAEEVAAAAAAASTTAEANVNDDQIAEDLNSQEPPTDSAIATASTAITTGEHGNGNSLACEYGDAEEESREGTLATTSPPQSSSDIVQVTALIKYLPNLLSVLSKLLTHPDSNNWESDVQYSPEPQKLLGTSRLRIVRLLESFVLLGRQDIDHILGQSECLEICLDLFWEFSWCSMLHQSVANLVVHVLEGGENRVELQHYFIFRCNLLQKLMDSFNHVTSSEKIEEETDKVQNQDLENVDGTDLTLRIKEFETKKSGSSLETEVDSSDDELDLVLSDPDNDDAIPVSDDDIDAAMEQEVQLGIDVDDEESNRMNSNNDRVNDDERNGHYTEEIDQQQTIPIATEVTESDDDDGKKSVESTKSNHKKETATTGPYWESLFRMGNMGHVIILCEAMVHACGVYKPASVDVDNNQEFDPEAVVADLEAAVANELDNVARGIDEAKNDSDSESEWSRKRKGHPPSNASDDEEDVAKRKSPLVDESDLIENIEDESKHQSGNVFLSTPYNEVDGSNIYELVEKHPLHSQWQNFVNTTVATEKATQTTPLGGCYNAQTDESLGAQSGGIPIESSSAFLDIETNDNEVRENGVYTSSEDIDISDNDLDIAANMMATMETPSGITTNEEHGSSGHHRRQRGVIVGQGNQSNGAAFGTVVEINQSSGEYLYDDPLGGNQRFEDDGNSAGQDNNIANASDEEDEADAPVMDLFAGNFADFEDAHGADGAQENDDSGWANFEDAFASAANDTPPNLSPVDFGNEISNNGEEDLFAAANPTDIIDGSADLFGTDESFTSEDLFGSNFSTDMAPTTMEVTNFAEQ